MRELIILFAFCVLLGLGCFGAVAWVVITPEEVGVEQVFLSIVALLLGGVFLGMSAWIVRSTSTREVGKLGSAEATSEPRQAAPQKEGQPTREEAGKPAS